MKIKEDSVLITCAVRYALGRTSYMPGAVMDELKPLLNKMSGRNLQVMQTDINEYIERVSQDWNLKFWIDFFVKINKEIERREIGSSTSWTSKEETSWRFAKLAEPQKRHHDGCMGCAHLEKDTEEYPCSECSYNYMDKYEGEL